MLRLAPTIGSLVVNQIGSVKYCYYNLNDVSKREEN